MNINIADKTTVVSQRYLDAGRQDLQLTRKEQAQGRRISPGGMRVTKVWDPRCYFSSVMKNGIEATRHDEDLRKDGIKKGAGFEVPVYSDSIHSRPLSSAGRANYEQIFARKDARTAISN